MERASGGSDRTPGHRTEAVVFDSIVDVPAAPSGRFKKAHAAPTQLHRNGAAGV